MIFCQFRNNFYRICIELRLFVVYIIPDVQRKTAQFVNF